MTAAIDRLREQLAREGPTNLVLVVRTADLREALSAIENAERVEREACAEVAMGVARCAVVGAEGFARSAVAAEIEQAIRARSKGEVK